MNLPDDLKDYHAPDAFQLFENPDTALVWFWACLIVGILVSGI
jgi:hypothetical protein